MTIYYKATQPDGTDFYTGTVHYQVGETLPALPTVPNPRCCTSSVYHVSTSKADTLIGGTWPCLLFEVEAEAVAEEDNKRGVYTMTVIRELPAWEALGPNGREVATLIQRVTQLAENEAEALATAWCTARDAARDADRGAAWTVARGEAWIAARKAARDADRGAAGEMARETAWGAVQAASRGAAWEIAWDAPWEVARGVAGYASWALVVRDLISEEHFNTLHGPWASTIK